MLATLVIYNAGVAKLVSGPYTRWVALGLAAAALGVVAFVGYQLRFNRSPIDPQACAGLSPPSERANCLEPYLQQAVRAGNTGAALARLEELFQSGVFDDCHMLAHQLGHITYAVGGNLSQAMRAGDARCAGGYLHGVIEASMHGPGDPSGHEQHQALDIASICTQFRDDSSTYDGCVHGLGHGAMQRSGNDVGQSLQDCDRLPRGYEQRRCRGGVFMQNSMQHLDLDEDRYRQVAPRGCDGMAISRDLLEMCYDQIGEVAMFYYQHDLTRATAICNAVQDRAGREFCLHGAREELRTVTNNRKQGRAPH